MSDFHPNLKYYVSQNNVGGANRAIMQELGKAVVHHRADFVDLLQNSDVPAHAELADAELLKLYFDNLHSKELIIGSALLVNIHNKTSGFDGSDEINDKAVKSCYRVMSNFFGANTAPTKQDKENHQFDWKYDALADREQKSGFVWDTLVKGGVGITGKVLDAQNKKKYGALDALTAKNQAKAEMAQSVIAERQAQIANIQKNKDQKAKNLKLGLIIGGSLLALGIGAFIYYKMKHK